MYPVEPKPPNNRLANLTSIEEMFEESRDNITGYCIKSMTSDPYGHPVLAVTDGKVSRSLITNLYMDNQCTQGVPYQSI